MNNVEAADKAEDAVKFLKCEVRTAFYYQKIVRNLFNRLAAVRGLGDLVLDRVEPESPEDLYKFVVKNSQTGQVIAEGNLHEARFQLSFPALGSHFGRENDFIKGYLELCGLKAA